MQPRNAKFQSVSKSFMILEATSFRGGFGVWMNNLFDTMEGELIAGGARPPYAVRFKAGGDGFNLPVTIDMFEAKA